MAENVEEYDLFAAAEELANYLSEQPDYSKVDLDIVRALVHILNERYVALATKLDTTQLEVVS